jgi:hypothetical protein
MYNKEKKRKIQSRRDFDALPFVCVACFISLALCPS